MFNIAQNRRNYRRDKLGFKFGLLLIISGFVIVFALGFVLYGRAANIALEIGASYAADIVTAEIYEAVAEVMLDSSYSYSDVVDVVRDESGQIIALKNNMAAVNGLQAEIAGSVLRRINGEEAIEMEIPLGTLLGSAVFSGRGPGMLLKIVTVSNVRSAFNNSFASAGINQTKHQIFIIVEADVGIVFPGSSAEETITTELCIAETIIVGNVPETYINAQMKEGDYASGTGNLETPPGS